MNVEAEELFRLYKVDLGNMDIVRFIQTSLYQMTLDKYRYAFICILGR